ncbi:MAG TPA: glycosyltransferase family 39 protein [Pseudolabrys sp.]|nr:glycosyltransferase family 39 protein [Pseudolabrys sp.]
MAMSAVAIVVAIAAIFALSMFVDYAADPARLWHDVHHDRNGHFNFALDLALSLRNFDLLEFLLQLERARVWPPVHGLALASVLTIGGIDVRLAILPSLLGWVATIALTFLIARRLLVDRRSGITAGALAVTFALASPAFRLITADVMLEGLGAALTALSLYAYLRARDAPDSERWWGILALSLTALFFEKSNYWLLTVVPLAIAQLSEDVRGWLDWGRARLAAIDLRTIARDPFVITAALLLLLVIALYVRGPTVLHVFGTRLSLYPPENLVTIVWWVLFLRGARLWQANRAAIDKSGIAGRRLFYWHAVPIAVSFLLPKRLATFLWYVGPTHHAEGAYNPLHAAGTQWLAFSQGFHVAAWAATLVVVLAMVAAARLPQLARGARAVVFLAALSVLAVVLHPQQQWRFQTTWLFAIWALAGVGGAIILARLTSSLPALLRIGVAAAAVAGLAVAESQHRWTSMAYRAAIHPQSGPSDLELAKAYLPHLAGAPAIGFMATFSPSPFFAWTVHVDCRCRTRVDMPKPPPFLAREDYRRVAADWLKQTRADRIVIVNAPGLYAIPALGLTYDRLSGFVAAIESDPRFARVAVEPVSALGANVTIWQRQKE